MDKILIKLIEFQNQIRILHWQTNSFARHKAYDFIFGELGKVLDNFVEVYQGKYLKIEFTESTLELKNMSELQLNEYISEIITLLTIELPKKLDATDTDLLNIRDEILGLTHKLKYLCTLK
jgi:hypothetical protein